MRPEGRDAAVRGRAGQSVGGLQIARIEHLAYLGRRIFQGSRGIGCGGFTSQPAVVIAAASLYNCYSVSFAGRSVSIAPLTERPRRAYDASGKSAGSPCTVPDGTRSPAMSTWHGEP